MAACAVGHILGLDFPAWQQGLKNLGQIHRRCQVKGEARGILVLDDYGHHPTEIRSTLTGLAQAFPDRRLVVAFQPHRYSRTRALLPEFFPVFDQAGMVFITEIYGAGEDRLNGVSGRSVYEGIRRTGHPGVHFIEENAARPIISSTTSTPGTWSSPWGPGISGRPAKSCWPACKTRRRAWKGGAHEEKNRAAALPPRPPTPAPRSRRIPQKPQKKTGSAPGDAPKTVTAATASRENPEKPGFGAWPASSAC